MNNNLSAIVLQNTYPFYQAIPIIDIDRQESIPLVSIDNKKVKCTELSNFYCLCDSKSLPELVWDDLESKILNSSKGNS